MNMTTVTGIPGLDYILNGGIPTHSQVVLEGAPGTGKTTLGMQFLMHGAVSCGESGLYITFEELPAMIYRSMESFGWNIRELERQNKLRVICISPSVFMNEMMSAGSMLSSILETMSCRRIVIDSVSLYKQFAEEAPSFRKAFYSLTNLLRKFQITSLLISENQSSPEGEAPVEHYVADGVIRLSLKPFQSEYRLRKLEVLKMRNNKFLEGEHAYRITNNGIYVLPTMTMVEEMVMTDKHDRLSTGIEMLDRALGGGIPRGSVFAIDTNSRANYRYMLNSIFTKAMESNVNCVIQLSSLTNVKQFMAMMGKYNIPIRQQLEDGRLQLIEFYKRLETPESVDWVSDLSGLQGEQLLDSLNMVIDKCTKNAALEGKEMMLKFDLYSIANEQGIQAALQLFRQEHKRALAEGHTYIFLCNFSEMQPEAASVIKRSCSGVIRTWVDEVYQYVQVVKSPLGRITPPMMVENIEQIPYIRLL